MHGQGSLRNPPGSIELQLLGRGDKRWTFGCFSLGADTYVLRKLRKVQKEASDEVYRLVAKNFMKEVWLLSGATYSIYSTRSFQTQGRVQDAQY